MLPETVNCATLGKHIVVWVERDYTQSSFGWVTLKLYEQQSLTIEFCYSKGKFGFLEEFMDSCRALGDLQVGAFLMEQTPSNKVLNCSARARPKSGERYLIYWLERDPDGEEFQGYT